MNSERFHSYDPVQPLDSKEVKRKGKEKAKESSWKERARRHSFQSLLLKDLLKNLVEGLN